MDANNCMRVGADLRIRPKLNRHWLRADTQIRPYICTDN